MRLKRAILDALPIRMMRKAGIRFDEDGLTTQHAAPFLTDPQFVKAYRAGESTGSWDGASIRWRAHTVLWAAGVALKLPGDFVECGVNRGGLSRTIVEKHDLVTRGKRLYLLDTFGGFDPRYPPADLSHWAYSETYEAVQQTFSAYANAQIIRGAVPDTLGQIDSETFAFVHIDMNAVEPEKAALEFFWPRMTPGGLIILDDYGFAGHEAQQAVHDAFARANGFEILALPTGQGLALKH